VRRPAVLTGALAIAAFPHRAAIATEADQAAECRRLLDRTLAAMDARPALKEEFATGLMWLRLDALEALEAGDPESCLERVRRAAALLKVD
jgi:hypothetical protein